ncbi:GNAT family N-acetyltransferase [Bdellovibrio sp. HCB-162]|uniref:GNAT family N-acetyltransferase n=1 Tax=Bdellovibrio sp. HCB-162 TaxID=3394234 RepID=UPI0039BCBEE5
MKIVFKELTLGELIILHDSYFESGEPDAPLKRFSEMSPLEQKLALEVYSPEFHFAAWSGEKLIGFVGVYPDKEPINVGIFYIIHPSFRGQGYFASLLEALIAHCRSKYPHYKYIRALTRKENLASVRGLSKASFTYNGECVEELPQLVSYSEYLLSI